MTDGSTAHRVAAVDMPPIRQVQATFKKAARVQGKGMVEGILNIE